ncbi:hybrid sensor histidine kinase/response regulator [Virgisporangium ochraceum]|uniref:histidine kinase n=1 Tax=Virgisporangium ochraceum TaxID=65505 RepID=A0A8J3ZN44_9ACTN|nr:response regulator [Virgisporangium ochraceum]GIJ67112.1 signal transduction histidine kinase [Virgisporangium ochraceum]
MAADPYRYFRVEARELSDDLAGGVLDLERGQDPDAALARVLRAAHTLKGAARVVKQAGIAEAAHALEDVLDAHRADPAAVPAAAIAAALAEVDRIDAGIAALPASGPPAPPPGTAAPAKEPDQPAIVRTDTADVDDLLEAIGEAQTHLAPLRRGLDELDRIRRGIDLLRAQLDAPGAAGTRDRWRAVAAGLGDDLAAVTHDLVRSVEHGERELRQIRGSAEQLRLVRAGSIFPTLHRSARDAATQVGCRVAFTGAGGDTRLDPHVLSTVYGCLLHIVRNAVAHGIEPVGARRAAGKPDEGRVTVEVGRRGTRIVFTCRDDGRGVDVDAVRRAATRAGIDTASASPADLAALVLRGGISTAGTVTELSGRGVGMDMVRDTAARLGGEVTIASEPGRGTTVELTVPLSLLAVESLLVEAAGTLAVVPLDAVRQCLHLEGTGGGTIRFGAHTVPYLPLATVLGTRTTDARVAMVVSAPAGTAAIGLDRVVDTTTVVVRAVPPLAPAGAVVGGLCLDGEGNPRIVLDPAGLVAAATRGRAAVSEDRDVAAASRPVLVVDDSLTTRMLERSILESAGYAVETAASAEEALAKARDTRYGLFLVDVEMPGMDGFTFIEQTKADPVLREVPAILVSSRASPADRERGRQAGAAMHVDKGAFDQNELLDHIGRLVASG